MPTPKVVLYVDDEQHASSYYTDNLKARGFTVEYRSSAEAGLKYLKTRFAEIDMLVLDMMMPTPSGVTAAETDDGQATGIWFLKQARDIIETRKIPVLILTNSRRIALESEIHEQVLPLKWRLYVCTKTEVRAIHLPDRLTEILEG